MSPLYLLYEDRSLSQSTLTLRLKFDKLDYSPSSLHKTRGVELRVGGKIITKKSCPSANSLATERCRIYINYFRKSHPYFGCKNHWQLMCLK